MQSIQEQRELFSALVSTCDECGDDVFQSAMASATGTQTTCPNCLFLYQQLQSFWLETTGRTEELKVIAGNNNAQVLLKRVLTSFSYKGFHKPLILPSTVKLELTNRCNLHCQHCLANAGLSKNELSVSEIENTLTQAKALGVSAIALVGGEPLLRPDIGKIIEIISNLHMMYSISTNGTLLDEKKITVIKRPNLVKVSVSLDGNESYHNQLRGHPQAYRNALRGIKLLSSNQIKTAVAMVINRHNHLMIEEAIQAAIDHGATFFMVNDMIPVGRGVEIEKMCLTYPEYQAHTSRMMGFNRQYGEKIKMLWKGMRPDGKPDSAFGLLMKSICGAALTELTIDHEGYVQGCPFLPKTGENVLQKSLKDIWYHSEELGVYQTRGDLEGGCGNCKRKLSCSGCRARALGHTGSLKGPDVRCPVCQ